MATFFVVIVNFGVFIVNFEQISYMALAFPLLTLNKRLPEGTYISSLRHYLHFFENNSKCILKMVDVVIIL